MILLTRPEADVLIAPATRIMAILFGILARPCDVAALLAAAEKSGASNEHILPALIALIESGALVRLDDEDG